MRVLHFQLGVGYLTDGMLRVGPVALDARHLEGKYGWGFGVALTLYDGVGGHLASVSVGLGPWGNLFTEVYRWRAAEWEMP